MSESSHSTHEVFISYANADKRWADATCAELEAHRIRCWIAPRDITPGTEWGASIIRALDGCKIMVLIFSNHANKSPQVRREVERAISKGVIVLPCRIEDVAPVGSMEYALSNTHWLDAYTPPIERQLKLLAQSVQALLLPEGRGAGQRVPPRNDSSTAHPGRTRAVKTPPVAEDRSRPAPQPSRRRWLRTGAGVVIGCIALWIGSIFLQNWWASKQYHLEKSHGSRESFAKVNVGMTLKQMEEILGPGRQTDLIAKGKSYEFVLSDQSTWDLFPRFQESTLVRSWKKAILAGKVRHWGNSDYIFAAFDGDPAGEGKVEALWRQPGEFGAEMVLKPPDKWILTKDNFLKLKIGMTLKELENILGVGEPTRAPSTRGRDDDPWEIAGKENRVYQWTGGGDTDTNWIVLRAAFSESPSVAVSAKAKALSYNSKEWDEEKGVLSGTKK